MRERDTTGSSVDSDEFPDGFSDAISALISRTSAPTFRKYDVHRLATFSKLSAGSTEGASNSLR